MLFRSLITNTMLLLLQNPDVMAEVLADMGKAADSIAHPSVLRQGPRCEVPCKERGGTGRSRTGSMVSVWATGQRIAGQPGALAPPFTQRCRSRS